MVHLPFNVLVDLTYPRDFDLEYLLSQPLSNWDPILYIHFGIIGVFSLVSLLTAAAVVIITQRALRHEFTPVSVALGQATQLYPRLLLTQLLVLVLIVCGFFLFIVPGIVLLILSVFTSYAVVLNKVWGFTAVRVSAQVVWKHPWVVLSRLIGVGILIALPCFVILASAGSVDLYIIPAIGDTLVDVIAMFGIVYITCLFLELEQKNLEV